MVVITGRVAEGEADMLISQDYRLLYYIYMNYSVCLISGKNPVVAEIITNSYISFP